MSFLFEIRQPEKVMSVMELFKDQSLRWQLIVCIVGQIGQQLSGTSSF